jgi:ABC-type glycerol-3-phosphate transport system substrate-binding protein
MRRSVALLMLFVVIACSCVARGAAAQAAGGARKVTVTLVRWPYT